MVECSAFSKCKLVRPFPTLVQKCGVSALGSAVWAMDLRPLGLGGPMCSPKIPMESIGDADLRQSCLLHQHSLAHQCSPRACGANSWRVRAFLASNPGLSTKHNVPSNEDTQLCHSSKFFAPQLFFTVCVARPRSAWASDQTKFLQSVGFGVDGPISALARS